MRWNKAWAGRGLLVGAVLSLGAAGCHHGRHSEMTQEELQERAEDAAEFISKRADATDEQEQRIEQALEALVPELFALRPERQALVAELERALGAEKVDPQRIEDIRKKGLNLADRASARVSQRLVEAAQVLDQKQRAQLIQKWQRHRS